jgi:hypothetical protein
VRRPSWTSAWGRCSSWKPPTSQPSGCAWPPHPTVRCAWVVVACVCVLVAGRVLSAGTRHRCARFTRRHDTTHFTCTRCAVLCCTALRCCSCFPCFPCFPCSTTSGELQLEFVLVDARDPCRPFRFSVRVINDDDYTGVRARCAWGRSACWVTSGALAGGWRRARRQRGRPPHRRMAWRSSRAAVGLVAVVGTHASACSSAAGVSL